MIIHFKPEKAFQLAVYFCIIMGLARDTHNPQVWICYDRLFQQAMAVNPTLEWHWRESDLWLMATSDFTFLFASWHSPPVRQSQPSAASTSVNSSDEQCRRFNRAYAPSPRPTATTDMSAASVSVLGTWLGTALKYRSRPSRRHTPHDAIGDH